MITLKDFMEACDYKITEGSEYGWACYGHTAYTLDSWNGDQNGHTLSIVFDTKTQEVYQATAYDYSCDRAYRIINPGYRAAFLAEGRGRGVEDYAWEGDDGTPVEYVDLDLDEDFLEKAQAICTDQEYDTRVQVPLTLDRDQMYQMMMLAHEHDMTLNEFTEHVLREELARLAKN